MSDESTWREAAFEDFVRFSGRSLQRTAVLLAADQFAGEDLVQTTLAKAYGRWSAVSAADNPTAYVRQIMVNTHLSWLRRLTSAERTVAWIVDRAAPGDLAADHARRADLHTALRRLSPRVRTAVVLRYFEDLSQAETARLTAPRLVVLGRYALQPDRLWEVPFGSVVEVALDGARLPVTWRDISGEVRELCLSAWTGRPALDVPLRDMAVLAELLVDWGRGAGSGPRAW